MYYVFNGLTASGEYKYSVTLKFFMRCNSGRVFYNPALVSTFNKKTSAIISTIEVTLGKIETLSLTNTNPCISNPPSVCYEVGYYYFSLILPASSDGYIVASQVTYRIQGINNLGSGYNQTGATYTADIPGSNSFQDAQSNNGAIFTGDDLVIVCADNPFTYSFAAMDTDGDQLRYSFCEAYTHANGGPGTGAGIPPGTPPYPPVPYGPPFTGQNPLGGKVSIDPATGLITGIAPAAGAYVVTVCVEEIRSGIVIATQRKDIQINIAPCTITGAVLSPEYMLCKDTKSVTLSNLSASTLVKTQNWIIYDESGSPLTTSASPSLTYTFPDTGLYKIKLVVNSGLPCSDSTTSVAKVYPGFALKFDHDGECFNKPTRYIDASTSLYGVVNSWTWDFGESGIFSDTSNLQSPLYTYGTPGRKYAQLIAGNSVGCRDTLVDFVDIVDKPPVKLSFKDTLICINDVLQLSAGANGIFSWSPSNGMMNAQTSSPTVAPSSTTTYYVDLDADGCLNRDSVRVRVTDKVRLDVMNDTTICADDTIQLAINSDGTKYSWTPASQLSSATAATPAAVTPITTAYNITATIGGCSASDVIVVNTVPYPVANAGPDTIICDNTTGQLNANMVGHTFTWSPSATLVNSDHLNPIANPKTSTTYRLEVYDNKGCPKPAIDEVSITVLPPIVPGVGNDTAITRGQPLQLMASGGTSYAWSPIIGLSNPNISNPVAIITGSPDIIRYKVSIYNEAGCSDSAVVSVKVFATLPTVFVPNAFTPDRNGNNDVLKPIAVGMKQVEYFRVYNRWGQLVFSSAGDRQGWDGTLGGKLQSSGMYVWAVKAVDYTGNAYTKKGTTLLIR